MKWDPQHRSLRRLPDSQYPLPVYRTISTTGNGVLDKATRTQHPEDRIRMLRGIPMVSRADVVWEGYGKPHPNGFVVGPDDALYSRLDPYGQYKGVIAGVGIVCVADRVRLGNYVYLVHSSDWSTSLRPWVGKPTWSVLGKERTHTTYGIRGMVHPTDAPYRGDLGPLPPVLRSLHRGHHNPPHERRVFMCLLHRDPRPLCLVCAPARLHPLHQNHTLLTR